MSVYELSRDQITELKQTYLTNHLLEVEDRQPSWGELANADEIVSDAMVFETYDGVNFCDYDFCCSCGIPFN